MPLILHGQCVEHYGTGEAYLPVLDALRQVGQRPDRDRYLAVLHQYAPTWLRHLPGLVGTDTPTTRQDQPVNTTRDLMLRELAEGLDALAAETHGETPDGRRENQDNDCHRLFSPKPHRQVKRRADRAQTW